MGWDMRVVRLDLDLRNIDRQTRMEERDRSWAALRLNLGEGWEPFAVVPLGRDDYQVFLKKQLER